MKHSASQSQPLHPVFLVEVKGDKLLLKVPVVHELTKELTIEETGVLQDQLGQGKLRAILNRLALP